jgi:hypothetical protein
MPYSFTERDLLANPPYHYMFSRFDGPKFLSEYAASRDGALKRFDSVSPPAIGADVRSVLPTIGAGEIDTEHLLSLLVATVLAEQSLGVRDWVDVFARKFEASKRLRRSYGADLQPLDRTPLGRNCYAQLAFLVGCVIRDAGDLRLLNTLLKLNDLVLSTGELDDEAAALIGPAIRRELAFVRQIATRLGIGAIEATAC